MSFQKYIDSSEILKTLDQLGWHSMTEIQQLAVPLLKKRRSMMMQAKTGSGKTGAYLLPMLDLLDWEQNHCFGLVIAPTRELAAQIKETCEMVGKHKRVKCVSLVGKQPMSFQIQDLKQKTHVVCGTPGRIWDHICQGTLDMQNIQMVVLDEVDEMCRMGFLEDIHRILDSLSVKPTFCFCSATISDAVKDLADTYAKSYQMCLCKETTLTQNHLMKEGYEVDTKKKSEFLWKLLLWQKPSGAMIFCNTRESCGKLYQFFKQRSLDVSILHGGMDQTERNKQMEQFRYGETQFLIATDIAARGIDVEEVEWVVHYEIPQETEKFYHRSGRSGRMGHYGKSVALMDRQEQSLVSKIEETYGFSIVRNDPKAIFDLELDVQQEVQELNSKRIRKQKKQSLVIEGITRLYIYAGKKQKLRAGDIVGAVCQIPGIAFDDIGVIQVQDNGTYVEILHDLGAKVLTELKQRPIKNKIRKVERSHHQI